MPLFKYRAVDAEGNSVEGTCEDASAHGVAVTLMEKGLEVSAIHAVSSTPGLPHLSPRVRWQDMEVFCSQLHAITKSGLPLADSMKALAQDLGGKHLKSLLYDLHGLLERGYSLSEAVESNAMRFPPLLVTMIRAGERSGNLPGVLALLASYSERQIEMRDRFQAALAYPLLVALMTLGVLGFLLARVIPIFGEIFSDMGSRLPAPTRFLIDISSFTASHYGLMMAVLSAVFLMLFLLYRALQRTEEGAYTLHEILLNVPIYGTFFKNISMARFARTLSLLLASRVPVVESLELAAATSGNAVLRRAVMHAGTQVSKGEKMAEALTESRFFGRTFCWMLGVAEDRGDAPETLFNLSESYDRQVMGFDTMVIKLMGPVLLLGVGFVLGFVLLALYMPIFSLGDMIS